MSPTTDQPETEIGDALDRLAASATTQANCMFQLALMVARIAAEPCADTYKEEAAQALLGLIRAKPKSNVVRLFGAPGAAADEPSDASPVEQFAAPLTRAAP